MRDYFTALAAAIVGVAVSVLAGVLTVALAARLWLAVMP
jgi:hypothetical protein